MISGTDRNKRVAMQYYYDTLPMIGNRWHPDTGDSALYDILQDN